jgi:hypothetical protein
LNEYFSLTDLKTEDALTAYSNLVTRNTQNSVIGPDFRSFFWNNQESLIPKWWYNIFWYMQIVILRAVYWIEIKNKSLILVLFISFLCGLIIRFLIDLRLAPFPLAKWWNLLYFIMSFFTFNFRIFLNNGFLFCYLFFYMFVILPKEYDFLLKTRDLFIFINKLLLIIFYDFSKFIILIDQGFDFICIFIIILILNIILILILAILVYYSLFSRYFHFRNVLITTIS